MKKVLTGLSLITVCLLLHAAIPSPQNITLSWSHPSPSTNITFIVHWSATATAALPWVAIKTVPGTNLSTVLSVVPGEAYYYMTASNFWGESDPSNVAGTPALPSSGVLSISKGP